MNGSVQARARGRESVQGAPVLRPRPTRRATRAQRGTEAAAAAAREAEREGKGKRKGKTEALALALALALVQSPNRAAGAPRA